MASNAIDTSDDELAAACAGRDESPHDRRLAENAFRTLYDRHAKRLLAFLGGRVSLSVLDDVHQDVWAKVWQAVPTGFQGGNFRAWVHQIARNVVIDHQRKRRDESLVDDLVDQRHWENTRSVESDRHDALARCLQRLERANPRVAELVRSRAAGESYETYSKRTGVPTDRAYRDFYLAKAQLQACVAETSP
jgi:RNA polymerase sigma factor (sigma-70 family)